MGMLLLDLLLLLIACAIWPSKPDQPKPKSDGDFILFNELDNDANRPYDNDGKNEF